MSQSEKNPLIETAYESVTTNNPIYKPEKELSYFVILMKYIFFINCVAYTILERISHDDVPDLQNQIIEHPLWSAFNLCCSCFVTVFCGSLVFGFFGEYSMVILNSVLIYVNFILATRHKDLCNALFQ